MAQITLNSTGVASNGSLVLQSNGTTAAVTIDTSQRAALVPGTAALPAITTTGDTNTGMWFPAADTIAFSEGGAESMRIDSSGVGIGTASPSFASGGGLAIYNSSVPRLKFTNSTTGDASTDGTQLLVSGSDFYIQQREAASVFISTNGTNAVTVDASQNVGIGTTSPAARLQVLGAGATGQGTADTYTLMYESTTQGNGAGLWFGAMSTENTGVIGSTTGSGNIAFQTYNGGWGERARITYDGNLLVGTTATNVTSGGYNFLINDGGTGYATQYIGHATGAPSGYAYLNFKYAGTTIGTITQNGTTAVAYNTSSDYRLKNTIAPMTGALAKVAQLKPVTYKWNADGSDGQGVIAHELQEVVPDCVTGEKDAVETYTDEDGNEQTRPKYQGVDTSFLVATLTAAIQELSAKVDTLQAELNTLKGN